MSHKRRFILFSGTFLLAMLGLMSLAHGAPPPEPPKYGSMLLQTVISLLIVCILAFVVLKWGLARLVGQTQQDSAIKVLARHPIEPRKSLLVVRIASSTLLLGSSDTGLTLLKELDEEDALAFEPSKDAQKNTHSESFSLTDSAETPLDPPPELEEPLSQKLDQ